MKASVFVDNKFVITDRRIIVWELLLLAEQCH